MALDRDVLVRAAVAATLRTVAEWGLTFIGSDGDRSARDDLHGIAEQVEMLSRHELCCPVCEEVTCDESCPLVGCRD